MASTFELVFDVKTLGEAELALVTQKQPPPYLDADNKWKLGGQVDWAAWQIAQFGMVLVFPDNTPDAAKVEFNKGLHRVAGAKFGDATVAAVGMVYADKARTIPKCTAVSYEEKSGESKEVEDSTILLDQVLIDPIGLSPPYLKPKLVQDPAGIFVAAFKQKFRIEFVLAQNKSHA